jgi:hypothetical protein
MSAVLAYLQTPAFLHLAGLAAVVVLLCLGIIPAAVGFPIVTGLVGLAIPTTLTTIGAAKEPPQS